MSSDLSNQLIAAQTGGTQHSVQTAILKKSLEMDLNVTAVIADAVQPPPPPGQGTKVDKVA